MPSSRSSTQSKLASPLLPAVESRSMPPPARRRIQRPQNMNDTLRLPSLPRFHPANFPSQNSSAANTPSGNSSPQPPVSPRSQQRQYSNAQKHLYAYQRETVAHAARGSRTATGVKPVSPRLQPLAGSPGPVTPLELEGAGGYLMARAGSSDQTVDAEFLDRLIREEAARRGDMSTSGRLTSVGSY